MRCIKTSVFHTVNHFDFGISKEAYFSASNHIVQQSNHQSGLSVMHSVFACMGSFRYFIQARSLKQHSLLYEFLVRVEGDWCPSFCTKFASFISTKHISCKLYFEHFLSLDTILHTQLRSSSTVPELMVDREKFFVVKSLSKVSCSQQLMRARKE